MRKLSPNAIAALVILLVTFAVYRLSPIYQVYDSRFTMLFSERLLWHGETSVPREAFSFLDGVNEANLERGGIFPYQLFWVPGGRERIYYFFPPGSTVLSMPFVAVMNAMGLSATDEQGKYDDRGEWRMQRRLGPFLMAILALVTFLTVRLLLPLGWSLLVTGAAAFATPLWSTASRAVMSDTWGVLLLGLVVWLLVRAEFSRAKLRPILLATLAAWMYFAKPTYCISIMGLSAYVLLFHRKSAVPYAFVGAGWLAAFLAFSKQHHGTWLPPYYHASRLTFEQASEAVTGLFIAPSRGLLVFVPVLCFVAYLLVRYWRWQRAPRLVWLSLAIFAGHTVVLVGNIPWNGGHCYGPRLMVGVVPWLTLLGTLAIDAWRRGREAVSSAAPRWPWRAELATGALLLLISVAMNAVGALSLNAMRWNVIPHNVDTHTERVWDWSDPQFLAPFVRRDGQPSSATR